MKAQRTTKRLLMAGVLLGALGTGSFALAQEGVQFDQKQDPTGGNVRENALPFPERSMRQDPAQQPMDSTGTGGSGNTGTLPRDEGALDPAVGGSDRNQGTSGMTQEPGTGSPDTTQGQGTRGANDSMVNEPGTGGSGTSGDGSVRNSNEGVLMPGVDDEGLDKDQGQSDQDTVYQGSNQQRPD